MSPIPPIPPDPEDRAEPSRGGIPGHIPGSPVDEGARARVLGEEQAFGEALFLRGQARLRNPGADRNEGIASGLADLLQASLAGLPDAREAFGQLRGRIPPELRMPTIGKVRWPELVFILGPFAEGHADHIRRSQEDDNGAESPQWLRFERELAKPMFLPSTGRRTSPLDPAFGASVRVNHLQIERILHNGRWVAATVIRMDGVFLEDGFPVHWAPTERGMQEAAFRLAAQSFRTWVRWDYRIG